VDNIADLYLQDPSIKVQSTDQLFNVLQNIGIQCSWLVFSM